MPRQPADLLRQQLPCSTSTAITAFVRLEKETTLFSGIKANQMQRSPVITRERKRDEEGEEGRLERLEQLLQEVFDARPSLKN